MKNEMTLLKDKMCYELEALKLELLQPGSAYSLAEDKELFIVDYIDDVIKRIILDVEDLICLDGGESSSVNIFNLPPLVFIP